LVFLPAVSGNWALFNSKPLVPTLAEKIAPYLSMIEFSPYFITVPIGLVMLGATIREYRRSGGQAAIGDAQIKDTVTVGLNVAESEFDFDAKTHLGGIVLYVSQTFDANTGHVGKVILTDVKGVLLSGVRCTRGHFHDGGQFKGPFDLQVASGTSVLHYGEAQAWWLVAGPDDNPRIKHKWGTPERKDEYPHPLGEYEATVQITAAGRMTERTVHYDLSGRSMTVIGIGSH